MLSINRVYRFRTNRYSANYVNGIIMSNCTQLQKNNNKITLPQNIDFN